MHCDEETLRTNKQSHALCTGFAASSFGVHCAQLAGLRAEVLQRAVEVIDAHSQV